MINGLADVTDQAITGSSALDQWLRFVVIMAGIIATGLTSYLSLRRKVDGVSQQATKAADLAEQSPMANGYSHRTEDALSVIVSTVGDMKAQLNRVEDKVDRHIGDHAAANVNSRGT